MRVVERSFLGVLLAATLATLLLVARNGLAPVQHPLTFGVVVWAWVVLLYALVVFALLLVAVSQPCCPDSGGCRRASSPVRPLVSRSQRSLRTRAPWRRS